MKAYPAYRTIGFDFLESIPTDWNVARLKHLSSLNFSNVDKHTFEDETPVRLCNYVDVYKNDFITPDMEFMLASATEVEINKFVLRKSDVLITKDSESWEDIAIPAYVTDDIDGVLCGYHLAQIRSTGINGKYLFWVLCSSTLNDQYKVEAHGITRYGLGKDSIENSIIPLPSPGEQQAIADFLDCKTAQIDTLIEKKQRQIDLLQEQRTALINHVVTKGLNPDAPMKNSGVGWLGEIPRHWRVTRLNRVTHGIGDGIHATPEYVDSSEYFFINGNNLVSGEIKISESAKCVSDDEFRKYFIELNDRTVLLSINGTIGNIALYNNEKVILGKSAAYIICGNVTLKNYLYYYLQSSTARDFYNIEVTGTTISNLSLRSIRNMPLPLLPDNEMLAIANFLSEEHGKTETLIGNVRKEIELLQEYRTALISEAVTGKFDAREMKS